VLAEMEASYWNDTNRNIGRDGNTRYPRVEIFDRINAARVMKSEEALQAFMRELSDNMKRHCRGLRKGAVAELDAQPQDAPSDTYRTGTPGSATSNESSPGKITATSDSDEETPRSSQDDGEHGRINSDSQSLGLSEPTETELPRHIFTSTLWEYAVGLGKEPNFEYGGVTDARVCEASLEGHHRRATATTKKEARHIASQMLCQALNIPRPL
jgi:hypothetical protein